MRHSVAVLLTSILLLGQGCADSLAYENPSTTRNLGEETPVIDPITLDLPTEPVFAGSYHRIPVTLDPSLGLEIEDLDFVVDPSAGLISVSRDRHFDPQTPSVILAVGTLEGIHKVEVFDPTGGYLGQGEFEITHEWDRDDEGPSFWLGHANHEVPVGNAIGGGPASPQNMNVSPVTGPWHVEVLFVDTSSARYSEEEQEKLTKAWNDVYLPETASYLREISQDAVIPNMSIKGFVSLPKAFDSYFSKNSHGLWAPKGSWMSTFILAFGEDAQYVSSIVFVTKSPDPAADKFAWPMATLGRPHPGLPGILIKSGPFGWVSMPSEERPAGRTSPVPILAHELLHNMGLTDQYTPSHEQISGDWEIMAWDWTLPHPTIAHKMMLGWAKNVDAVNASTIQLGTKKTLTLHPAGLAGSTPLHKFSAVEHRIASGWNHYFELRSPIRGQLGDQRLPSEDVVLITDVLSYDSLRDLALEDRPSILLAREDSYGHGPILERGDGWEYLDSSRSPTSFTFNVNDISHDNSLGQLEAQVEVQYDLQGRPDPSIRTRPAGKRKWQSPDIEIQNERSRAHPGKWWNTPWRGHDNEVIASITNYGGTDAPGVEVRFYVMNYTVSNPRRLPLGTQYVDIPAGATEKVSVNWRPPNTGHHYCIVVEIAPYVVPGTQVKEISGANNVASSNYDRFISSYASPASRESAYFDVTNPLEEPAIFFVGMQQTNPNFRTYLSHHWVALEPGESRTLEISSEYIHEDEGHPDDEYYHVDNEISLEGFVVPQELAPAHSMSTGGLDFVISSGLAIDCPKPTVTGGVVHGSVRVRRDGSPAPSSTALLVVAESKGLEESLKDVSFNDGHYSVILDNDDFDSVTIYYSGPPGYGDCEVEITL